MKVASEFSIPLADQTVINIPSFQSLPEVKVVNVVWAVVSVDGPVLDTEVAAVPALAPVAPFAVVVVLPAAPDEVTSAVDEDVTSAVDEDVTSAVEDDVTAPVDVAVLP